MLIPAASADHSASAALRERARRMKEIEDAARDKTAKEAELRELKAKEERLGKQVALKDVVSLELCGSVRAPWDGELTRGRVLRPTTA